MEPEKSLQWLQDYRTSNWALMGKTEIEAADYTELVLEHQQPQKPAKKEFKYGIQWYSCPLCESYVHGRWKWCPYCGQKLDWSEEK